MTAFHRAILQCSLYVLPALLLHQPRLALAVCSGDIVFQGGVSLDNGATYTSQVGANEPILIGGELCPRAEHVGLSATLYVAFQIGEVTYLLNAQDQLVEYDNVNLVAYRNASTLAASQPLQIYTGVVGAALNQVKLYVAYAVGGELILDTAPQTFSVHAFATLTPVQFDPVPQGTTAGIADPIRVTFDRNIDPASVSNTDLKVFGRWSGVRPGALVLENNNRTLRFTPAQALSSGELVQVQLPRSAIRASDGSTLMQGYSWSYWTGSTTAPLQFTESAVVSAREAGSITQIQTYGAYAGDLNHDGWSDFIVPNELSNDLRVFLNDGAGNYGEFTIIPIAGADRPSPNEGGDFDGDGDIDFAVGSAWGHHVHIFLGDGAGGLVQTQNLFVGERVRGVCLLDFENDGDPDIAATAFVDSQLSLFRNDGTGNFENAGVLNAGEGEWSCAAADMNEDGLTDLVVGTRTSDELLVLASNGDGTFTQVSSRPANGDPWMLAAGDLDRDGHVDIAAVNAVAKSLTVARGLGDGLLQAPISYSLLDNDDAFPLAVDMGDLDGDGDLDIVTADFRTRLFLIHENRGDGTFLRLPNSLYAPQAASCAILHDRDNDGDLDITGIDEVADVLLLYSH